MDCRCTLHFKTEKGEKRNFTINNARRNLTAAEINQSMDDIIANTLFDSEKGTLTEKLKAVYVKTSVWSVAI